MPGADDVDLPGGNFEVGKNGIETGVKEEETNGVLSSDDGSSDKRQSPPLVEDPQHSIKLESLRRQPSKSSLASVKSRIMVGDNFIKLHDDIKIFF